MDIAGPRGETGTPYARYYQFGPEGVDMEIGVVLGPPDDEPEPVLAPADGHLGTKVGSAVLPGGRAARVLHFGAYDTLKDAYDTLMAWIPEQGETPGVGAWELYLTMPGPGARGSRPAHRGGLADPLEGRRSGVQVAPSEPRFPDTFPFAVQVARLPCGCPFSVRACTLDIVDGVPSRTGRAQRVAVRVGGVHQATDLTE